MGDAKATTQEKVAKKKALVNSTTKQKSGIFWSTRSTVKANEAGLGSGEGGGEQNLG